MVVKDHSGEIEKIQTWINSYDELEMKTFGNSGFLWHFSESTDPGLTESGELINGEFYCPIYEAEESGQTVRKTNHLFYILNPRDEDDDTMFLEIGPAGYINPANHPTDLLLRDLDNRDLIPLTLVSSSKKPPEETIRILRKLNK
jgi:hypothetical protein